MFNIKLNFLLSPFFIHRWRIPQKWFYNFSWYLRKMSTRSFMSWYHSGTTSVTTSVPKERYHQKSCNDERQSGIWYRYIMFFMNFFLILEMKMKNQNVGNTKTFATIDGRHSSKQLFNHSGRVASIKLQLYVFISSCPKILKNWNVSLCLHAQSHSSILMKSKQDAHCLIIF